MADELDDQLEHLEQQFESPEAEGGDQDLGEPTGDEAGEPDTLPPGEPAPPEMVEFAGRQFSQDEVQSLVEFYDWARANPQQIAAFDGYLRGQYDLVPQGMQQQAPPSPAQEAPVEEEDDLEQFDPRLRREVERLRALEASVQGMARHQVAQQYAGAQQAVAAASEQFREKFDLNDEQLENLATATARAGILPGLAAQRGDWVAATEEALEMTYWTIPEFRERQVARQVQAQAADQKRQRKASALSGSSGSVPRQARAPQTNEERRLAMAAELRQHMDGGSA